MRLYQHKYSVRWVGAVVILKVGVLVLVSIYFCVLFASPPPTVRLLWVALVWAVGFDRCWSSGLQTTGKGFSNDKKLQSSNIQCDAAQNPLGESWHLCMEPKQYRSVWGSPATFSDNVARIWSSKRTVSVKVGFRVWKEKKRKKEIKKRK